LTGDYGIFDHRPPHETFQSTCSRKATLCFSGLISVPKQLLTQS
jgi:hypothetical protein